MYLKQLIEYLEKKDCDLVVPIGFDEPHSYRGDYMCLAFEPAGDVTVGAMLQCARDAIGSIYEGSNGAHYRMNLSTEVYLAIRGKSSEKIGTVLLDYMTGVYDSEECEHLRGVISRSTDEIAGLIVDRNNVRTDLASADAELFEYRKKIVEQSKAIHDLTTDTADEIKVDRCRIDSLVEERNDLNRWFINDRDTLRSIERTCAELGMYNPKAVSRDVKAIKSMKRISNIMEEWDPNIGREEESKSWRKNGYAIISAAIDWDEVIKQQNQTLLHIKAELEAAKQYNPFNLVLISGSIENISNIVDDHFASVPTIDEWDGGCVGCCKVADVAAKLQEELEDTEIKLVGCRKLIDYQDHTIRELRTMLEAKTKANQAIIHDKNIIIEELHTKIWELERTLPANFWDVVAGRDATIRKQRTTIEELKDRNIEDLHELYALDKKESDRLKAELSVCKGDSEVFKKVVEIVKNWDDLSVVDRYSTSTITAIRRLYHVVKDYTDGTKR